MYSSYDPPRFVPLLDLLMEHGSEYLSGQDLSDVLKTSRITVWKHIEKLRTLGYGIKSDKVHGYRLESLPDIAYPWEITRNLKSTLYGKIAYYFDVTGSTQDYAAMLAQEPAKKGALVIAGEQNAGRGRGDSVWESPSGGIWMSLVSGSAVGFEATLFPIAAAVALAGAIRKVTDTDVRVKWPNDILYGADKIAGIITDAANGENGIAQIVLGVGINYNVAADAIKKSAKRDDIASLNGDSVKVALIQEFLYALEAEVSAMEKDKGNGTIGRWTDISSTIGASITAESGSGIVSGKAVRLDADGALVLHDGTVEHRIVSGTIRINSA